MWLAFYPTKGFLEQKLNIEIRDQIQLVKLVIEQPVSVRCIFF